MTLKKKYGNLALVAGGTEGIGAAFAQYLAANGMDIVLVARNNEKLQNTASIIKNRYGVEVTCIICDLSLPDAYDVIADKLKGKHIDFLVYNAALSFIGAFEKSDSDNNSRIIQTNVITPIKLIESFAQPMLEKGKGGIVIMSSLAGMQGSGYLTLYSATKAFCRVLAESLWYEWQQKGVDVIACIAGATSSPNYINSKPNKSGFLAPRVQTPEEVVADCLKKLGKSPSTITGTGNKIASFFMHRLLPSKLAVKIMGDNTRRIYDV